MPTQPLSRRTLLRGIAGTAIALPFLEAMLPRQASAASAPLRYVYAFGGSSISCNGADSDLVVPTQQGLLGAGLPRGLKPINTLQIEPYVSIVSGMKIPWADAPNTPPGGRRIGFHASSLCPLVCGVRTDPGGSEAPTGETSEFFASRTLSPDPTYQVLTYRVQPAYYRGSNGTGGDRGKISARMNQGTLEQVEPTTSPQVAWASLNFQPTDPAKIEKAKALLARRISVLDLVGSDTQSLLARLGKADQIRLQRHLDEVRALEMRLQAMHPDGGACVPPPDPGMDPPIGGAVENGDTGGYASNGAWSNEELRASTMIDLIHMALTCDRTRVASIMFTQAQCFLNMNPIFAYSTDLHEMSHGSMGYANAGMGAVADGVSWHVKHFGTLVQKLANTVDSDGSKMIENTALLLAFEGGHGFDPEQSQQNSPHSTENMITLIAGRAGGLNKTGGKHLVMQDRHPVEVVNTALNAVGVPGNLGEVTGTMPELST